MSDEQSNAVAEVLPRGVASLRDHRWRPGTSGNPKGRPPRGFSSAERFRTALAEDLPEILEKVLEKAKAGDLAAAKIIIDRCIPAYRVVEKPVNITGLSGSLAEAGAALVAAVGRGDIAPGQASQLLIGMGALARVQETAELEKRIAELQAWREEEAKRPPADPVGDDADDEGDADGE